MQIRLLKSQLEEIGESAEWDAGDHAWWVRERIDNAVEATIELINDNLFEKDQIVIVPEEKYLKCDCQFKIVNKQSQSGYGYYEVYEHTSYCMEHEDENPDLYDYCGNIKPCLECEMDETEVPVNG